MLRRKHEIFADLATGRIGAYESPLTEVLADAVHALSLKLDDDELRRLYLWLFRIGSASQKPRQSFLGGMAFEDPALDATLNRSPSLFLSLALDM